jgi:hypothetical protein
LSYSVSYQVCAPSAPKLWLARAPAPEICPGSWHAARLEPDLAHATHALPSLPACNSPVPGLHHSRNVRKSHGAPLLSRFHFRFSICQLHQRSAHVPTDQTTPVGSAVPMPPRDHAFLGACGRFFLFTVVFQSFDLKKRLYSRMALGAEDGRHRRPRSPI